MSYSVDDANKLLERTHAAVTREFARTAATTAAILLQLRSHERALEHHDDIVLVLKSELLDAVCATYNTMAELLNTVPDFTDDKAAAAFMDNAASSGYGKRVAGLCDGYAKAFPNSDMARALLVEIQAMLVKSLDSSVRALVMFLRVCDDAIKRGMLANPRPSLLTELAKGIKQACDMTVIDVNNMCDYACPAMDAVAVKEHGEFMKAVADGKAPAAALAAAHTTVKDEVTALIKACELKRTGE